MVVSAMTEMRLRRLGIWWINRCGTHFFDAPEHHGINECACGIIYSVPDRGTREPWTQYYCSKLCADRCIPF